MFVIGGIGPVAGGGYGALASIERIAPGGVTTVATPLVGARSHMGVVIVPPYAFLIGGNNRVFRSPLEPLPVNQRPIGVVSVLWLQNASVEFTLQLAVRVSSVSVCVHVLDDDDHCTRALRNRARS